MKKLVLFTAFVLGAATIQAKEIFAHLDMSPSKERIAQDDQNIFKGLPIAHFFMKSQKLLPAILEESSIALNGSTKVRPYQLASPSRCSSVSCSHSAAVWMHRCALFRPDGRNIYPAKCDQI